MRHIGISQTNRFTTPQHGHWNHFYLIVSAFVFVYLIAAIGIGVYYTSTRCPYSSLVACQTAAKEKCGSLTLGGTSDCEKFVSEIEPCYCHECRFCLGPKERAHCQRTNEDRLSMCATQLAVDSELIGV